MLIALPELVSGSDIDEGMRTAAARKPDLPVNDLRVLTLAEGRCLQAMHVGPYDAEGPLLAELHGTIMPGLGVTWNGLHHEIYLGDPQRTAPERLKTVLRQPVRSTTQLS